jgi:hypothetical protein
MWDVLWEAPEEDKVRESNVLKDRSHNNGKRDVSSTALPLLFFRGKVRVHIKPSQMKKQPRSALKS